VSGLCRNHSADEVLKILSLLQLQVQNHGKNIRIEKIVTEVVNSITETKHAFDREQLRGDILKH
jgi:hypothetical protein